MSKIITVFGATGQQGGSVVRALLADPQLSQEFKIRGVTRDVSKPAAKALAEQGVELVSADMSSPETAGPAVKGAHTVFLVTNFWESMSADTEIAQGKAVADASKAAGVKHIIFSSLINVNDATDGRLPNISHFDGKADIEAYINSIGLPGTFFQPGFFMSGFLQTFRAGDDGSYTWAWPEGTAKAKVPLFDPVADTGNYVKIAIKGFPDRVGSRIHAAVRYYTVDEIVDEWQEVTGKTLKFVQLPHDTWKSYLPAPVAQELLENMLLLADVGYYAGADLAETNKLLDEPATTWRQYVEANKSKW